MAASHPVLFMPPPARSVPCVKVQLVPLAVAVAVAAVVVVVVRERGNTCTAGGIATTTEWDSKKHAFI